MRFLFLLALCKPIEKRKIWGGGGLGFNIGIYGIKDFTPVH